MAADWSLPLGALPTDTAEYLLGRVAVTPVLLESNGAIDANLENWTPSHKAEVLRKVEQSLDWWTSLLAKEAPLHSLEFVIDTTWIDSPQPTPYEPISRISNHYTLWVGDFLNQVGIAGDATLEPRVRAFNHRQRERLQTDWSFTIFVPNAAADADGSFASGGHFTNAFAFSGGLFEVVPSRRPAATFAHEMGHIFYARDEYAGGGDYYARRGYYDSQNTNAVDRNPTPNFQQAVSIMAAGNLMADAYQNVETAAATLAQVGWRDSDGDGIFDVLDVPLSLEVTGYVDTQGVWQISGRAAAEALPNRNSSGRGSSITLNRVGGMQYRFAGESQWRELAAASDQVWNFNLQLPVDAANVGRAIELRAVEANLPITSGIVRLNSNASRQLGGLEGLVGLAWNDADADGLYTTDASRIGWQVVVDRNDGSLPAWTAIDPNTAAAGEVMFDQFEGLAIRDRDSFDGTGVHIAAGVKLAGQTFRPYSAFTQRLLDGWNNARQFQVFPSDPASDFTILANAITPSATVRIRLYDAANVLLESKTFVVGSTAAGQELRVARQSADIKAIYVQVVDEGVAEFGKLSAGTPNVATIDASGQFEFHALPSGNYNVTLVPPVDHYEYTAGAKTQTVTYTAGGTASLQFGSRLPDNAWHNLADPLDVDGSGGVTVLDFLAVINAINRHGSGALEDKPIAVTHRVDVVRDFRVTPQDALAIINLINQRRRNSLSGGEGESLATATSVSPADSADAIFAADLSDILDRKRRTS